uniref:Uncharacterized protein n=1 Tax=Cyprinus carpio TaxID=7962 RepID=A0A8C1SV85_CYPCA
MLGLGTLLPWNFFMTATMVSTLRIASNILSDPLSEANFSVNATEEESRSVLQAKFNNVMTLCAMVPLLVFTCLNSVLHQRSDTLTHRAAIQITVIFLLNYFKKFFFIDVNIFILINIYLKYIHYLI